MLDYIHLHTHYIHITLGIQIYISSVRREVVYLESLITSLSTH